MIAQTVRETPIHELAITSAVLNLALEHAGRIPDRKVKRIVAIRLQIGELRGVVDEWMQRYFDRMSRGTLAEGAQLRVKRVPVTIGCSACAVVFPVAVRELERAQCPACKSAQCRVQTGREFLLDGIEVACE